MMDDGRIDGLSFGSQRTPKNRKVEGFRYRASGSWRVHQIRFQSVSQPGTGKAGRQADNFL